MSIKSIFKYEIPDNGKVVLPTGASILHIDAVGNKLFLWAAVLPQAPSETKTFLVLPTGGQVPFGYEHIKTVLLHGGTFVFHVFKPVNP